MNNPYKKLKKAFYAISISEWKAYAEFNRYAYGWDKESSQFEEQLYLEMCGVITESSTKKVKTEQKAVIRLYPSSHWYEKTSDITHLDIGAINKNPVTKLLTFTLGIPTNAYENIRANLSYKPNGEIGIMGSETNYGKGEIYSFTFN